MPRQKKRSESRMKYFKPELYLRYNSRDDAVADRADREWEKAIHAYKEHLSMFSERMNDRVKDLAENLRLHDAQLMSSQGYLSALPLRPVFRTWVMSLRSNGKIVNLFYLLWGEVAVSTAQKKWPFSKLWTHSLYDEVDFEPDSPFLYWHRILLSDGRVSSIPFFDVFVHSFSEQNSETAISSRGRAQPTPTSQLEPTRRRSVRREEREKFGIR
jgi:hypothetical protein